MSDTFDHGLDAWESRSDDFLGSVGTGHSGDNYGFVKNPLYYHELILFRHIHSTEKAYHIEVNTGQERIKIWVPKKITRDVEINEKNIGHMWVHSKTLCLIMEKEVEKIDEQHQ